MAFKLVNLCNIYYINNEYNITYIYIYMYNGMYSLPCDIQLLLKTLFISLKDYGFT